MPLISAYLCKLGRKFTGGTGTYTGNLRVCGGGGLDRGGPVVVGGKLPRSPLATGPAVEAFKMHCGLGKR